MPPKQNIVKYLDKRRASGKAVVPRRQKKNEPPRKMTGHVDNQAYFNALRTELIHNEFATLSRVGNQIYHPGAPLTTEARKVIKKDLGVLRGLVGRPVWEEPDTLLYEGRA